MIKRRFLGLVLGLLAAGGAGAIVKYYLLRTGIEGVQRGYLLDDEEPLESFFEEEGEGPFVPCTPADFDADACEAAVDPPTL